MDASRPGRPGVARLFARLANRCGRPAAFACILLCAHPLIASAAEKAVAAATEPASAVNNAAAPANAAANAPNSAASEAKNAAAAAKSATALLPSGQQAALTPAGAASAATAAVKVIAGDALPYVGALAAAGVLAMAIVEFLKAVLTLQLIFQRASLCLWLGMKWKDIFVWRKTPGDVLPELLYLAIGDRKHLNVLCGQDLPKMMGQIQAAARLALDFPDKFPKLYVFLTGTDLSKAGVPLPLDDSTKLQAHALAVHAAVDVPGPLPGQQLPAFVGPPQLNPNVLSQPTAAQTQARLANLVSRKLDGFQLRTSYWWARFCQLLAMATSIVICCTALSMVESSLAKSAPGSELSILWQLGIGFVGGLLAPFVKDLSQALAKLAGK